MGQSFAIISIAIRAIFSGARAKKDLKNTVFKTIFYRDIRPICRHTNIPSIQGFLRFSRHYRRIMSISCIEGTAMKPVSELLRKRPQTLWHIRPEATVFDALKMLAEYGVGALMVMEGGKLVGVVSERDYTRKIALEGRSSKDTQVADIMTRNVLVVSPQTRTRACMALMSEKKIRHLPVVDGDTVVGMISIRDIMDDIIADHEYTISQLENYIRQ
jgi:signal-transduction protein with cAMP-binding, CBS, and nucleotidyltransferase domain